MRDAEGMNAGLWKELKSVHAGEEVDLDLIVTKMLDQGVFLSKGIESKYLITF